jgi:hypothetical protein
MLTTYTPGPEQLEAAIHKSEIRRKMRAALSALTNNLSPAESILANAMQPHDHAVRMGKTRRTQQNRTHDPENRSIRAYAQSQRKHPQLFQLSRKATIGFTLAARRAGM